MIWSIPNFSSHCCFSSSKTWLFPKRWKPPSDEKCWQTRPEQHRSPNSDSSQTLLGTVYSKRNVKMQNESTRKSRKEPKEGPCTHWKSINQFRAGSILWMKQSDKKVSFQGPQNGGHFSCGKPVPHLRTSPVCCLGKIPGGAPFSQKIPWHLQNRKKTTQQTKKQTNKQANTPTQTTSGKCHWMVKQVVKKRETPEALMCWTPRGRIRHLLSSSVGDDVDIP